MATLYWDPDGIPGNNNVTTGAGLGGSGRWSNDPIACWFNPATGKDVAWTNAPGDAAFFVGGSQAKVSVAGSITCAAATFQSNFLELQSDASQAGSLLIAPSGITLSVATGTAVTISVPITGAGDVSKLGAGLLVFSANETYTGLTTVLAGTLDVRGNLASHVTASGGTIAGLVFFDPDLAAAVRETLGMSVDAVLTPSNVAGLSALTVDGNKISDLTGLNPANTPNLAALSLLPGDFSAKPAGLMSLAPLAGLTKLKTLAIQHVGLTDAVLEKTLPSLPALDTLDVRFNAIGMVPTNVAGLPGLSTLLVHGNPLLADSPREGLKNLKGRPVDVDVAADAPESAETVADLAASLYYLPQKMLEYVTNTIAFQPYVGLMKGPLATLQTRAGNDWDTNTLLSELFSAAGISTRWVSGRIAVTDKQLMDYVGARDVTAAANILATAGIAAGLGSLAHTWVEASVKVPGAAAAAWMPFDASWKFRDFRPGVIGILQNVPFSPVETDYLTNPSWQTKTTADYYESKVATWLATNRPGVTTADVAYDGPIRQQLISSLPKGLPYPVLSTEADLSRSTAIPDTAKYFVGISLSNGATPLFSTTRSLEDISLKRLTIDPQLTAAGTLAQPVLRIDGVGSAAAVSKVPASAQVSLTITIKSPVAGQTYTRTFGRGADRFLAIGLDANQFTDAAIVRKRAVANAEQLNMANHAPVDNEKAVGGLLDLAIASYFNATDADEGSIAGLTGAVANRFAVALGIATSGPTLSTTATPSLQFSYLPADMGIDVPANVGGAMPIDQSTTALDLNRDTLIGYSNSALEGLTLEELTNFDSISTVKAFQMVAASRGMSGLVEINAGNVDKIETLLPGVRAEIRTVIANTVTNGLAGLADYVGVTFKAFVPATEVSLGATTPEKQWKGVGYTLTCVTADAADKRNGRTVGFIIHGAVGGGALKSYGGATSWYSSPVTVAKPAFQVNSPANYLGDPVNIANGNVYAEQTDVEIPNLGVPLAFRRHFDSVNTMSSVGSPGNWSDRGMGEGWSFTYSDQLKVGTDGTVTWFTDQGLRLEFAKTATGYTNPAGMFGTLVGPAPSGFTWTDVDGKITTFGAAVGNGDNAVYPLSSIKDRFGNGIKVELLPGTTTLAKVSDLMDGTRCLSFTYNADTPKHLISIADFTGRTWTYGYTGSRLATVTAPVPAVGLSNPVVRYAYYSDAARQGLLQSVTDPLGNVTSWEYYANRRGFRVTDASGNRHSLSYDLHRYQSSFVDERGKLSRYSYDAKGNLVELRQADRTVERSTWYDNGLKETSTDAYGAIERYTYDSFGKIHVVNDRAGRETFYDYTSGQFHDIDVITDYNDPNDPTDHVLTKFEYDKTGFLTSRIDDYGLGRMNLRTQFLTQGRGLAATSTAPSGVTTWFTYNAAGQPVSSERYLLTTLTVRELDHFDNRGNLDSKTDGNGVVTIYGFDDLGRKTKETTADPDGTAGPLPALVTTFNYDAAGNLTGTSLGDGRTTSDSYDRLQRSVKSVREDGTFTLSSYDPVGNLVSQTDAAGRSTRYLYDLRNRRVATLYPDGTGEQTRYDGGGRIVAVTDRAGATTTFTYDSLGRRVTETGPSPDGTSPGPVTRTGYDGRGNLVVVTDPLGVMVGDRAHSTFYEYDNAGRRTKETLADPDGSGPLAAPVTVFGYDTDGQLKAVTDPRGFTTTTYAYDPLGRKASTTTADPDGEGPLLPLVPLVTQYRYDAAGNLRYEIAPGGVDENDLSFTTEHLYDRLNREIRTILPDPDGASGPLGRPTVDRIYDASGYLATTTDPLGRTTTSTFDKLGRVVSLKNAAGDVSTTLYDAVGNTVVATDPLGRRTVSSFDAMNRPVAVRAASPSAGAQGPVTSMRYDAAGRLTATTDPLGHTSWKQYDRLGRLISETDALGAAAGEAQHTTVTTYDLAGRVTSVTDELGRRTDYGYDNLGRKTTLTQPDPDGNGSLTSPRTLFGYDASGNQTTVTDPLGFVTTTAFDGLGRKVTTTTDPDGTPGPLSPLVTKQVYNTIGRLAATVDELGRQTDYDYDNLGRRTSEKAPAPDATAPWRPETRSTYDAVGNLTSVTDPLGFVTRYGYDALNRRTIVTDALSLSTVTAYNPSGTTRSVTDASGNVTTYAYDRLDRLISETDPFGKQTLHAYDLSGNETAQTDRLGRVTTYLYDAADRRVEERWQQSATSPITHTIRTWLDAAGQPLGVTETDTANPAATTAWQFTYDALGQLVKSRMAPGELVQEPVTVSGDLLPGDQTIDWDNDGKAERVDVIRSISVVAGDVIELTADATGFNPALLLFQASKPQLVFWSENSFPSGSLVFRRVADATDTWTFALSARDENATGSYAVKIVKNGNAIVPTALVEYDFSYDKSGNLISAREDQSAVAVLEGYGQAATGLGKWTNPIYDALNRVIRTRQIDTTSNAIEKVAIYTYRGDDSVATITRNAGGVGTNTVGTTTNTYDGLGRLTEITHKPSAQGSPAIPYRYTFDAASRISTFTTPEGTSTLALDATDQLKSASLTKESYTYDNTGNRTGSGLVTDKGNRLLSDGTYRYGYDAEGNRTTKFIDVDNSGTLSAGDTDITLSGYDQRNRLVSVSHVNASTATQAGAVAAFTAQGTAVPGSDLELRFTYDYADRRIRRSMDSDGVAGIGQASVSFAAYAGDVRTVEIAQTATVSAGGRVIGFLGQVVERNFYGNGEDEILAVDKISWNGTTPTTSTFWTFADHQGTIRDIVSGNAADRGKVVEHRQYDSFGKILARTANAGVAFGYTGRPIDEKTGLSDDRARWYDANTGRFVNEDPSGFKGGDTNLFRYVGNDPLDRVDPSGLTAKWAGYGGKGSVPAAAFGAYGTSGLMSVTEFGRLSGSLGSQPPSVNAAPKSSSQFMASATQLFMQHFTGKPGVHDLYSEKGFPVSARSVDSSGATREYKFADGTRYMQPTEPSTAQYADGATLAFAPLRVATQGGSALRVAGSAAGNVVDYAASNYASRRASEATGGYLAMMPAPVTALLTGRRGGVVSSLDDGAGVGNNLVRQAPARLSPGQLGRQGESLASKISGAGKNTQSFVVNGRTRIPDQILAQDIATRRPTIIGEVKNVRRQSRTRQLMDDIDLVGPGGRVDVYLPPAAKITRPLQRAFDDPLNPLNRVPLVHPQ